MGTRSRTVVGVLTALTVTSAAAALSVGLGAAPAGASTNTVPHYVGTAGGSYVRALGGTITSGLTSASYMDTIAAPSSSSNNLADVHALTLLDADAIKTSISATNDSGNPALAAAARTSGASLLGGLITAKVVDTQAGITFANGRPSTNMSTTFVDLKIVGVKLPVTIKPNTTVRIPNVASITLDYASARTSGSTTMTQAAGAIITLLQKRGDSPAGTVIYLNPLSAAIGWVGAGFRELGGYAYATKVSVHVGDQVTVNSGATAATAVPRSGTGGRDVDNNTAGLNLPGLATARAVGTTANGLQSDSRSYAEETADITGLNLFNGLITADALKGTATISTTGSGAPLATQQTSLVNLVIDGHAIPANVAPNTRIDIAGLGTVTINAQAHTSMASAVRLLDVQLSTAKYGLPAGAEVEVGTAVAYLFY